MQQLVALLGEVRGVGGEGGLGAAASGSCRGDVRELFGAVEVDGRLPVLGLRVLGQDQHAGVLLLAAGAGDGGEPPLLARRSVLDGVEELGVAGGVGPVVDL
ncbi:hypothetical protein [Streptomyces sp. NPDC058294]|uniref:hypothetical protein n=1 Tax=Streptomyces sp. NPDC058294 TaxID=3346430 RepID=UPI0036F02381